MKYISKVAIVGGTHGNELIGAYLIRKFEQNQNLLHDFNFDVIALLANPRAFAEKRRFIDRDLNRAFLFRELSDLSSLRYEDQQAKLINEVIGPKGSPTIDFIIDLHSKQRPVEQRPVEWCNSGGAAPA